MAKAIDIAKTKARELDALAVSAAVVVILLGYVSLLIGGVVSPLLAEW